MYTSVARIENEWTIRLWDVGYALHDFWNQDPNSYRSTKSKLHRISNQYGINIHRNHFYKVLLILFLRTKMGIFLLFFNYCHRREPKATEDGIHSFTHKEVGQTFHNFARVSVFQFRLNSVPVASISLLFHRHQKDFSGFVLM